jgi:mannose-6-phosphate isomerase-like protein (cupin superfamily)
LASSNLLKERKEIKTANHTQVVLVSLKPGEDIGLEVHKKIDQLLVFVQNKGEANINVQKFPINEGDIAFVPASTPHNFKNTGAICRTNLCIYPPHHGGSNLWRNRISKSILQVIA